MVRQKCSGIRRSYLVTECHYHCILIIPWLGPVLDGNSAIHYQRLSAARCGDLGLYFGSVIPDRTVAGILVKAIGHTDWAVTHASAVAVGSICDQLYVVDNHSEWQPVRIRHQAALPPCFPRSVGFRPVFFSQTAVIWSCCHPSTATTSQ